MVPDAEEFLLDPVKTTEMYPDFQKNSGTKKFITKGPKPREEEKKENRNEVKPVEKKEEVRKEEVKKEEKKVEVAVKVGPEEFRTFKFLKSCFPLKSSFKEWIL